MRGLKAAVSPIEKTNKRTIIRKDERYRRARELRRGDPDESFWVASHSDQSVETVRRSPLINILRAKWADRQSYLLVVDWGTDERSSVVANVVDQRRGKLVGGRDVRGGGRQARARPPRWLEPEDRHIPGRLWLGQQGGR